MKRIALLYSGEIRNLLDCFNNHYENFVLANPDYQVDIFAHLWKYPHERDELIPRIIKTLDPKTIEFENPRIFNKSDVIPDPRFPHPTQRFYSMFYGLDQVNKQKVQYEKENKFKYDYVVRLRTDTLFINPIGKIDQYDNSKIHLQLDWAHMEYGVNDQFSFGSSDNMNIFLSVYENLDKLYEMGCAINPECLLGFNAQILHNLNIEKHQWNFKLWRSIIHYLNQ